LGEGSLSRFLERRGEGLHHIALGVSDIHGSLKRMKEAGIRLVDEVPRPGAEGGLVAFLHPKSTRSVLVELCEEAPP
jgi:methylmalonyl-CoA epimerase